MGGKERETGRTGLHEQAVTLRAISGETPGKPIES
jgi:hypothetical protein